MKSNNTTLQAHNGTLQYENTVHVGEKHKILVYTIAGTQTFVYAPSFYQNGTWYGYAVNGETFATFVYENARRIVAGKR